MLQTWIHRIRPGKEARLRDWLAELSWRSGELRDSLAAAGVRAEQAWVVPGESGSLLVYVSEAEDQVHAAKVYASSTLPLDLEHREVMQECIEETLGDAPVYDVSV